MHEDSIVYGHVRYSESTVCTPEPSSSPTTPTHTPHTCHSGAQPLMPPLRLAVAALTRVACLSLRTCGLAK